MPQTAIQNTRLNKDSFDKLCLWNIVAYFEFLKNEIVTPKVVIYSYLKSKLHLLFKESFSPSTFKLHLLFKESFSPSTFNFLVICHGYFYFSYFISKVFFFLEYMYNHLYNY